MARHGIEKVFRGVLRYQKTTKSAMVSRLREVNASPCPSGVFLTCVDARLQPSAFTQTDPGDMFIVRNVGNMLPNAKDVSTTATATEPAALELGCAMNGIRDVFVCGHSDCKAMHALHSKSKSQGEWAEEKLRGSPIKAWIARLGTTSLRRFEELERSNFKAPLSLSGGGQAFIDVDGKFDDADRLSMVNTLVQAENASSHGFMSELLREGKALVHAMWFDVRSGDLLYFSRREKTFVAIEESNVSCLLGEIEGA